MTQTFLILSSSRWKARGFLEVFSSPMFHDFYAYTPYRNQEVAKTSNFEALVLKQQTH